MTTIFIIISIIFIISLIVLWILGCSIKEKIKSYKEWETKNSELEKDNVLLTERQESLKGVIQLAEKELDDKYTKLLVIRDELEQSQNIFYSSLENYCEILDKNYIQKEKEYNDLIKILQKTYEKEHDKVLHDLETIQKELETIKATRYAAQEAINKERQMEADLSFYCLNPTEMEKDDIYALERVKPKLHQPRILCMLIWSTYFQKPMTQLCNNILGTKTICGIYKITNQQTKECYIGQAVDVAKRWKDHAKCGLGIDTPAKNKLYKAMQEYGIWNFSWELLETCDKEQLNEKENFYIELYDSNNYGYNSSIGVKKISFDEL